jgi:regulator of protease activity HflC (stomatin/prohibitin superfamily)
MPDGNFVLVVIVLLLMNAIKHLREWERGVVVRLGKFHDVRGPGITFVIPLIERMYRINMRPIAIDVPPQDIVMKDEVWEAALAVHDAMTARFAELRADIVLASRPVALQRKRFNQAFCWTRDGGRARTPSTISQTNLTGGKPRGLL